MLWAAALGLLTSLPAAVPVRLPGRLQNANRIEAAAADVPAGGVASAGRASFLSAGAVARRNATAASAGSSTQRIFYKEITFGAPFGFKELEKELRCNGHVRGTEAGKVSWGAQVTEAVRLLYFEPVGSQPMQAVLQAYRDHCARTDLMTCVSPECKVAVFYTTEEQKTAVGTFPNAHDTSPLLRCTSLTTWATAAFSDQGALAPACSTDKWATNIRFNSTLTADIVPLSERCST